MNFEAVWCSTIFRWWRLTENPTIGAASNAFNVASRWTRALWTNTKSSSFATSATRGFSTYKTSPSTTMAALSLLKTSKGWSLKCSMKSIIIFKLQRKGKRTSWKRKNGKGFEWETLPSVREQNLPWGRHRYTGGGIPSHVRQMHRMHARFWRQRHGTRTSRRRQPQALLQILLRQDFWHLCSQHYGDGHDRPRGCHSRPGIVRDKRWQRKFVCLPNDAANTIAWWSKCMKHHAHQSQY